MADSSRHSLFFVAESTYGTTPASPAFKTFRHTSASVALAKGTMLSEELRSDRQIADYRHGIRRTGGEIGCELSFNSFEDILQAVMCGTWTTKFNPYSATTISTSSTDNSINSSANALPICDPGDRITLSGFSAGSVTNNQTVTVVTSTASKMVVTSSPALVTQAAGTSHTLTCLSQGLKAGITRRSFSLLRRFEDMSPEQFHLFTGVEFNTFGLTAETENAVNLTFGVVGQDALAASSTAPAGSTYPAASTTGMMDNFSGRILEGGTEIAIVSSFNMTLENGIEPRFSLGSKTSRIRPSIGRSNLSGELTAYFEDVAMLNKFYNETSSSLQMIFNDQAGNQYSFVIPNVKYNGGQPDVSGQGSIMLTLPWQAIYNTAAASQLAITRSPVS